MKMGGFLPKLAVEAKIGFFYGSTAMESSANTHTHTHTHTHTLTITNDQEAVDSGFS